MSKKGWEERQWEKVAEQEYSENLKDPSRITGVKKGAKRFVHEAIPSNAIQWIKKNHSALEGAYINYVGKQANFLNNAASFLSEEFGIDLHKEHPISVSGAGDVELSPTTAMSDRGPNDQGFSGNARFNRRLNSKNAFNRGDLDELGVASNWQYSAANFVADRPDIKDVALRAEMGLQPLGPKVSNLGMLKLQQGDLNIDTLQMKMFIEQDLKNSGFGLDADQQARLGAYFKDLESKEMVINAEKHSWKVDKHGNKVLDAQGRPIPTGDWDLKNKFKYDNPTGSEHLARRTADSQNAAIRHGKANRQTHLIPNGENGTNGTNGTNGSKLNGKVKNGNGKKLLGLGVVGGALTNFMPTKAAAEEIYPMIQEGNFGGAAKAYGKDLVVGQSTSRAMGSAVKMLQSKFGKNMTKQLARQALKIAGKQLVKKAGALATGPAAPIVMTSLLIKDAYDVANALSGGGLEAQKVDTSNRKRLRHGRK